MNWIKFNVDRGAIGMPVNLIRALRHGAYWSLWASGYYVEIRVGNDFRYDLFSSQDFSERNREKCNEIYYHVFALKDAPESLEVEYDVN